MARGEQAVATQPRLGPLGWARWGWRQLTSMRTALVLLLLLAVAAVPGSIWPQRAVDPVRVREYQDEHPGLAPVLDSLGFFDVYSSPWFAAIYLLLMVSLVGCLVPRTRQHLGALRARPPAVPRRLERLAEHRTLHVGAPPEEAVAAVREVLQRRRYRFRDDTGTDALSAEGGRARETGNLVFHFSLLAVIIFVAAGHLWGWRGEVILAEGETFTNTVAEYDTLQPGPWVDENALTPFSLTLEELTVVFEQQAGGAQFGAPREFTATVSATPRPGGEPERQRLAVNAPLSFSGTSVYLLGNGYAPVVTVRDADGEVLYRGATPFLPQDDLYASTGAVKVPAADPDWGFHGAFLPTLHFDETAGPVSTFPDLLDPALVLGMYEGALYPEGRPQSVYTLDVSQMEEVYRADGERARLLLRPGETVDLPGGGTMTLEEVVRWGGLVMRHDPGRVPVLVSSAVLLLALTLMLTVRRRRVFARAAPTGPAPSRSGDTVLVVAALAKGSDPGLGEALDRLCERVREALPPAAGEDHPTKDRR